MTTIVPSGAVFQPITEAEYEREGAKTNAPNALMNIWQQVGAFVVPDRGEGRYGCGAYSIVDPYTAAWLVQRSRQSWQWALNGYPFVEYDRFTTFCMGTDGTVRVSFDAFVITTDPWAFLQELADDLSFVERLTDECRRRDNPAAITHSDIRAATRDLIEEIRPAALSDLRLLVPRLLGRFPSRDDASLLRTIAKDELASTLKLGRA